MKGEKSRARPFGVMPQIMVLTWFMAAAGDGKADYKYCFDGESVEVRFGSQIFAIPLDYKPHITTLDQKSFFPHNAAINPRGCGGRPNHHISQPIVAYRLGMQFGHRDVVHDARTQQMSGVSINIWFRGSPGSESALARDKFIRRIEKSTVSYESLPQIYGFLARDRVEGTQVYLGPFMAAPDGIKSPDGFPVVIDCSRATAPSAADKPALTSEICRVSYQWTDGASISYRFSEDRYPMDKWAALDSSVRTFVRYLMVATEK